jgi:hypothetical protein
MENRRKTGSSFFSDTDMHTSFIPACATIKKNECRLMNVSGINARAYSCDGIFTEAGAS